MAGLRWQPHPGAGEKGGTYAKPVHNVGISRVAGATGVLLIASRLDHDGVVDGALARGVEGAHVEDVDALHLTQDLQTLQTGRLLEIGRDGTGLGTGADQVVLALDLCSKEARGVSKAVPRGFVEFRARPRSMGAPLAGAARARGPR